MPPASPKQRTCIYNSNPAHTGQSKSARLSKENMHEEKPLQESNPPPAEPSPSPSPRCNKKLYDGNTEALGWALDTIARTVGYLAPGVYLSVAVLQAATEEAGCETNIPEGELKAPECNERIYGLRPSSLVTTYGTIVGLISALSLPVGGAIIDHTPHRKLIGFWTAVIQIFFLIGQAFTSKSNWLVMFILQVFNAFFGWVHTLTIYAYLPELTDNPKVLVGWTTNFGIIQYFITILFLGYMVGFLRVTGFDGDEDDIIAARIASISALVIATPCYFLTWIALMKKRDAFHTRPEGSSLWTMGFVKNYYTSVKLYQKYRAVMWFFVNVALIDATSQSIAAISLTYSTDTLRLTAAETGISLLMLFLFGIVGSVVGYYSVSCINAIRSNQLSQLFIAVNTAVGVLILNGPNQQFRAYSIAAGWGIGYGWKNVVERFTTCVIIPKGQDAELMGFYLFASQVLGWLPTLIFTVINEAGGSQRIGLLMLIPFFLGGIFALSMTGSFDEAVKLAEEDRNRNEEDSLRQG